ncbi:sugar phosphate isomerase/epimerase family protein [Arenibacter sp. GZD96]|uniref:sugar phosphate isomerase/epimerase family protein n=1 Tax=Aurantibrevibacter litoralis TaxID=3106030 RepID=UPI002AFE7E0B|nr:sugar phosphate isomerase/epimerase family protein [Arenibacter sp. GZD-96]MEA1784516.1 sugar phosphate isomerase/epimerase family protein [Arenibacter sp. GZD-96]
MNTTTKFGVSTWLWESPFTSQSVALFPKIKAMGYDLVEIPVEDPSLIDGELVKKALEANDLGVVVCGAFGPTKDFTHEDRAVHQHCFNYIEQCFQLCTILGGGFLAGPMYSAVGKARLVSSEQKKREWDSAVTNLTAVCKMAGRYGLEIALEPLNRFESDLVNTAEDVMRLVTDINQKEAKVLLDGFHMTIEEKNIKEAIKTVGNKLLHVQVSENHRGVPGTGLTPWNDFKEGLAEIHYQGAIVIESFTPEIKELAAAVCIWKNLAPNQDAFATDGLQFLKQTFNS